MLLKFPALSAFILTTAKRCKRFGVEIKNILGCSEKEAIYPPIINSWGLEMLSLKLKGYKIDKRNTLRNFLFLS